MPPLTVIVSERAKDVKNGRDLATVYVDPLEHGAPAASQMDCETAIATWASINMPSGSDLDPDTTAVSALSVPYSWWSSVMHYILTVHKANQSLGHVAGTIGHNAV